MSPKHSTTRGAGKPPKPPLWPDPWACPYPHPVKGTSSPPTLGSTRETLFSPPPAASGGPVKPGRKFLSVLVNSYWQRKARGPCWGQWGTTRWGTHKPRLETRRQGKARALLLAPERNMPRRLQQSSHQAGLCSRWEAVGCGPTAGLGSTGCPHTLRPRRAAKQRTRVKTAAPRARQRSPIPSAVSSGILYWQPSTVHTGDSQKGSHPRLQGRPWKGHLELTDHEWITGTLMQLKASLTAYLVAWQNNGFGVGLLNHSEMPEFP